MATVEESPFAAALRLLQGTNANFAVCCVSMAASLGSSVLSLTLMVTNDGMEDRWSWTERKTAALNSLLFLVAQAFTLAKVARDFWFFKASDLGRPTRAYFFQVALFFVIALGFALEILHTMPAVIEWRCLFLVALLWAAVSAMCLSKAVRDRADSHRYAELGPEHHSESLSDMHALIHGTVEYRVVVWLAATSALLLLLGLVWSWNSLAIERKGFVTVAALWCETSCFHFAKLVRDRGDPARAKDLNLQLPYQAMVCASMLGSTGGLVGGAVAMPLDLPKRLFLITASGFMVTSAALLAKHVRDQQELKRLTKSDNPIV